MHQIEDDLYRLYREEWVIVHTESADSDTAEKVVTAAHQHAHTAYENKVDDDRLRIDAHTDNAGHFWAHVVMLKPNMKGEFKYAALAENFATKCGFDDYEIVTRNSRRDFELRSFGIKPQNR